MKGNQAGNKRLENSRIVHFAKTPPTEAEDTLMSFLFSQFVQFSASLVIGQVALKENTSFL